MKVEKKDFGRLYDGREAQLFILSNDNGVGVKITNYGAIITSIETPDKHGNIESIVCGFDKLENYLSEDYINACPYFGALIGRCGNRIAKGDLNIDGETYKLAVNNGPNHLHGGVTGFDKKLWKANTIGEHDFVGVELEYFSRHLEENYPGNLTVKVRYTLNNNNELALEYFAETDRKTVVNITNHTYFNLTGRKENILNHELKLTAEKYTELVDQIPTGKILPVKGSPFDFSKFKTFNSGLTDLPTGYDDNFVLDNQEGSLKLVATLKENNSGRKVDMLTTQPGMQLYTGYWIPEFEVDGKKDFGSYAGVAMETQHYPDSVHHSHFPSTILNPGEKYNQKTVYKFSAE